MPLPTISTPTYELTLPSSNRKIKYRPFLVKEEKILIIAMESQDTKQIARAVKDVLTKCILTKGIKVDDTFELIASCVDQVYSEEESWTQEDCTKKELTNFIEQLNSSQFKEIEKFFDTMPKLAHTVKVTNPNTKVESEIVIEGLQSFFG